MSGAGRKAEIATLFAEAADNFKAYAVSGHRHLPEIQQGLSTMAGHPVGLTFVPHLTPLIRGIHATLYARIKGEADFQQPVSYTHLDVYKRQDPYSVAPGASVRSPSPHMLHRTISVCIFDLQNVLISCIL